MAKVYQLFSGEYVQHLAVAEESREFYTSQSRRRSNGIWDFGSGGSKKDCWQPISLYIREPLEEPADIYKFSSSVLILEQRARDALAPVIESCGEVYEQPVEGRKCYVLNVMRFCEEPVGKDDFPEDGLYYPLEGVDSSIVRRPGGRVIAVSGVTPPELDFKLLVEKHNLKGLWFREVWDSENYIPPPSQEDE
ncbi:MAG: hypothetical protein R3C01_07295 [Planctomycetaceae bacterium]